MKRLLNMLLCMQASLFLLATVPLLPVATNWKADPAKAKVTFSIKGPFGTVHGSFSGLKANIRFDEKDLAGSAVSASVDAATVSTGIGLRNRDLRKKEEWLNTDKYPQISFASKKIEKASTGYKAVGDLTLKGATRHIEIPFTFTPSGNSGVFKGHFTINRREYKVGKEGGSVGSDITIDLEVPV
ncbi:MAG TPA: YceI family protein, partial [Chitinophagaceae bacterium]|nr:YceI family protein [Chitinophagaceae bacterium]